MTLCGAKGPRFSRRFVCVHPQSWFESGHLAFGGIYLAAGVSVDLTRSPPGVLLSPPAKPSPDDLTMTPAIERNKGVGGGSAGVRVTGEVGRGKWGGEREGDLGR